MTHAGLKLQSDDHTPWLLHPSQPHITPRYKRQKHTPHMPHKSANIRLFVALQSLPSHKSSHTSSHKPLHDDLQELVKAKYNVQVTTESSDEHKTSLPYFHMIQAAHHAFDAAQSYDENTHLRADDLAELASHTSMLLTMLKTPQTDQSTTVSTPARNANICSNCSIYDQNVTTDHEYQTLGCKFGKFQQSVSGYNLVTGINAVTFVMTLSNRQQASVLICDSLPPTHRQPASKFALTGSHFVTSGKNVVQLEQSVMRSHFCKTRCEEPSASMHIRKQMKTCHVNSIKNILHVTSHTDTVLHCGEFGSMWSTPINIDTPIDHNNQDSSVCFYSFFMC